VSAMRRAVHGENPGRTRPRLVFGSSESLLACLSRYCPGFGCLRPKAGHLRHSRRKCGVLEYALTAWWIFHLVEFTQSTPCKNASSSRPAASMAHPMPSTSSARRVPRLELAR
jgi:hypothetical protein